MHLKDETAQSAAGEIASIAQRLCGAAVVSVDRCGGGANNRVYRISTERSTYALKCYTPDGRDDRDRLAHEYDGLRFLAETRAGAVVPAALAVDRAARCALYEWIDGAPVGGHDSSDIAAVLTFIARLHDARSAAGAAALPFATEAVLRLSDLIAQIEARAARLTAVAPANAELAAFLGDELTPELELRIERARGAAWDDALPAAMQTLSPSDLGFHNALRRRDGTLAFIDFEYFGWDDPVKLTADFLWHPAMCLDSAERRAFIAGALALYAGDPGFAPRLRAHFPLYGLRWTLIVLNEFLPQMWERRAFSRSGLDPAAAQREQLRKARSMLASLRSLGEGETS